MTTPWAVALAGPGDVTLAAAEALLDDWLPENDLTVFVAPAKRTHKGLKNVIKWLDDVGQDYETEDDPVTALLATPEGTERYLVLLWGEEGDDATEDLLARATKEEIPVKDLTAGLDDLILEDEAPAPAPEPEEKPRRGRARDTEQTEKVLDKLEADRKKDEALRAAERADEGQNTEEVALAAQTATAGVEAAPQALLTALDGFVRAIVTEMTAPKPIGRPRADGQPAGGADPNAEVIKVIYDEEAGEYRKRGRGRPRKGEVVKEITVGEAKKLGIELDE